MTPEQQQRIEQIKKRLSVHREMLPTRDEADFLLSIVEEQEAADVPAMIAALKAREDEGMELRARLNNAADQMRSACVEKAQQVRRNSARTDNQDYERGFKDALDSVETALVGSVSIQEQKK